MRYVLLLLVWGCASVAAHAQTPEATSPRARTGLPCPKNAAFIEAGGNGLLLSVNYERRVLFNAGIRIGVSYLPTFFDTPETYAFPVMATYTFADHRRSQVQLGFGPLFRYGAVDDFYTERRAYEPFYTALAGFRYTARNGFLVQLAFTPVYAFAEGNESTAGWEPWGGVAVGYAF